MSYVSKEMIEQVSKEMSKSMSERGIQPKLLVFGTADNISSSNEFYKNMWLDAKKDDNTGSQQ